MPYESASIEVQSPFGVSIRNRFYQHTPPSEKLMILLPGRGYTVAHPALLHLQHVGLEHGYDVLPVQYGFQVMQGDLETAQMPFLMEDTRRAVEQVTERGYREVCVVGKSLGTPLAVELAQELDIAEKSLILLTPIGSAVQDALAQGIRTLAVIGTEDPLYSAEAVQTSEADAARWYVMADLDHSFLKANDWKASVRSLYDILAACEAFLLKQ